MPQNESNRRSLIALQRGMVKRLKRRMKRYIRQTPELERYYQEYRRELHEFQVPSYPDELLQRIAASDITYVGDFHTLLPTQKLVVRILEMLASLESMAERPVVVALEAFHAAHQRHLDDYLAGRCTFQELLERSRYRRNWGFPVQGYQRIVETCRERGHRIIGINSTPRVSDAPLRARDERAAKVIVRERKRAPDALFLVLIGDLHVATTHLPEQVLQLSQRRKLPVRDVIVFTNAEDIYWELTSKNLEYMINVVKINSRCYCVMNATPLAMYESYLRFVEGVVDDREWDPFDDYPIAAPDIEEQIVDFARQMAFFLGLGDVDLPEFEVTTWEDVEETVPHLARRYGATPEEVPAIVSCLKARQPVFIGPYGLFLHQFSLNDAADAAARLLLRAFGWEKPLGGNRDDYFRDILHEALVYFATKVINPKRTCKRESDLADYARRERVRRPPAGNSAASQGVIESQVHPHLRRLWAALAAGDPRQFRVAPAWWRPPLSRRLQATRLLGFRLGERLFYSAQVGLPGALLRQGRNRRMTRRQVARLLRWPPAPGADVQRLYLDVWFATADVVEHHHKRDDWL